MTRQQLETGIAAITQQLKGPLTNIERQMLVADRRDFRDELQNLDITDQDLIETSQMSINEAQRQ